MGTSLFRGLFASIFFLLDFVTRVVGTGFFLMIACDGCCGVFVDMVFCASG